MTTPHTAVNRAKMAISECGPSCFDIIHKNCIYRNVYFTANFMNSKTIYVHIIKIETELYVNTTLMFNYIVTKICKDILRILSTCIYFLYDDVFLHL